MVAPSSHLLEMRQSGLDSSNQQKTKKSVWKAAEDGKAFSQGLFLWFLIIVFPPPHLI